MANRNRRLEEQGEDFDARSLDGLHDPELDDYGEREVFDEIEDENEVEEKRGLMNSISNAMNMSGKGKAILSIILILGIVAVIVLKPVLSNEATNTGEEGEKKGILSFFSKKDTPEEEIVDGETDTFKELQEAFPEYIIENTEDGSILLTGEVEGSPHILMYSLDGQLLSEDYGGEQLVDQEGGEGATTEEGQPSGTNTNEIEVKEYEIPEDSVIVKKSDYDRSIDSLYIQPIVAEYDELGEPIKEMWEDRFIVKYEKLPIKGRLAMIYAQVIETGERLIFPIPLEQYMSLTDTGTTVVGFTAVKMHGVVTFDNIYLVDWKN